MAPKQFVAPKVWKRPYTSIYNDNYRFGNSLYAGAIDDIERKYNESMSRTQFRADRPDLQFDTFAGHSGSPGVSESRNIGSLDHDYSHHDLSKSSSSPKLFSSHVRDEMTRLNESITRRVEAATQDIDSERTRRRRRPRPESAYYGDFGASTSTPDTVAQNLTMDRCRELQIEIDRLFNHVIDAEARAKNEVVTLKNKVGIETRELTLQLEDQSRVAQDLMKTIKKQERQIQDLQVNYDKTQYAYGEALDELNQVHKKASQLAHEVDFIRHGLDKAIFKVKAI